MGSAWSHRRLDQECGRPTLLVRLTSVDRLDQRRDAPSSVRMVWEDPALSDGPAPCSEAGFSPLGHAERIPDASHLA
jgi:hypothetical protein